MGVREFELAVVVEGADVLVFDEVVEVWEVLDRGRSYSPIVNVVEEVDTFSPGETCEQAFQICVVWGFIELQLFAVVEVSGELSRAIPAETRW